MGRKGVSKRKKPKVKAAPASGGISSLFGIKTDSQPEQAAEKPKSPPKGSKKR
jgi:hypothetical protein